MVGRMSEWVMGAFWRFFTASDTMPYVYFWINKEYHLND